MVTLVDVLFLASKMKQLLPAHLPAQVHIYAYRHRASVSRQVGQPRGGSSLAPSLEAAPGIRTLQLQDPSGGFLDQSLCADVSPALAFFRLQLRRRLLGRDAQVGP